MKLAKMLDFFPFRKRQGRGGLRPDEHFAAVLGYLFGCIAGAFGQFETLRPVIYRVGCIRVADLNAKNVPHQKLCVYALLRNQHYKHRNHSTCPAVPSLNRARDIPVQLLTSDCPLLGSIDNFFETVRRYFAADGEEEACGDDGGLRISVDVRTLALAALTLLSFQSIFRICVFDNLIVDYCFALMNFFVVVFCEVDDRDGQSEVVPLFFNYHKALKKRVSLRGALDTSGGGGKGGLENSLSIHQNESHQICSNESSKAHTLALSCVLLNLGSAVHNHTALKAQASSGRHTACAWTCFFASSLPAKELTA
jgi:hypothetical protein